MVPQPGAAPRSTDPETLLSSSIENWKRKLLDLTKRNRALHFRPARVSTVTIVDEQPSEVFRQLYLREKPMRFKAAPEGRHRKMLEPERSFPDYPCQSSARPGCLPIRRGWQRSGLWSQSADLELRGLGPGLKGPGPDHLLQLRGRNGKILAGSSSESIPETIVRRATPSASETQPQCRKLRSTHWGSPWGWPSSC